VSLDKFISYKKKEEKFKKSIIHEIKIPKKDGSYKDIPDDMFHPKINSLIKLKKIRFWTHQVEAFEKIARKKNVIISTSTASGKTYCYLYPILDRLLKSGYKSSFLLVYPLKALAQDQYQKISKFFSILGIPKDLIGIYDADTSPHQKSMIRRRCKIIITNPYGLHQYLGNLRLWKEFYRYIDLIVFDEVHVYSGVFGSNIAFVMRRLQRAANAFYRNPQWVFCSATIGNPLELAQKLTGLKFDLVSNDGSSSGPKTFWFWNPMFVDKLNQRISYHQDTRLLFHSFISAHHQTLVFCQSRKMAELQAKWARDFFYHTSARDKIMSYRAGYPAKTRREIERKIRNKELMGISATSALELGIDIGSLDVVIISGFPGSVSSLWQQAGRCGRGDVPSLVIYCAGNDALDQYYINHPDYLFEKDRENAVIDTTNPYILRGQLECAVKELPIETGDIYYFGPWAKEILEEMRADNIVFKNRSRYFYNKNDFPAERISLNSIPSENYKVFKVKNGKKTLLTTETENRVFSSLHEGAIFLFLAETYRVLKLDLEAKEVILKREDVDYYTEPLYDTMIIPLSKEDGDLVPIAEIDSIRPLKKIYRGKEKEELIVYFGDVQVEKQYQRYLEKSITTGEVINYHDLDLPKVKFNTKALWFNIPVDVKAELDEINKKFLAGAIHAVEHGTISLFPKLVLCSRWDIGGVSYEMDPKYRHPMIYIYDGFPGGIGLAEKASENILELLFDTLDLIKKCQCNTDNGCPGCIQSPKCGNGNQPLSKPGAIKLLELLLADVDPSALK